MLKMIGNFPSIPDPEEGLEYIPYTVIHEFAHILSFDTNTYVAFSEDEDLQDAIESLLRLGCF
ncbi:hypothetical protein MASR2M15_29890 [Anaerolineales bacterium]